MIVKNEQQNLTRCLNSISHIVTEIIVVDTGSTDSTQRIAGEFGAIVLPFEFTTVDFSAARNHGLDRATAPWILVLDADERIVDPAAIVPLIERNLNAGYFLERHNHYREQGTVKRDYVVRLFPNNSQFRYRGRVHETIDNSILEAGGKLIRTGVRIDHDFSVDSYQRRLKNLQYVAILKEEIAAKPSDSTRLDFLAAEYHQLEMYDEAANVAAEITRLRPLDPRAHLFMGVYHLVYQSNPVLARTDFYTALQLRPGYTEAQSFLQLIDSTTSSNAI